MNILDELAACARLRVERKKQEFPEENVREAAYALASKLPSADAGADVYDRVSVRYPFEKALLAPGLSFICECKKASPSKGIIAEKFPYLDIALQYESAGADAISVLTEPKWFLGKDEYLKEIAEAVGIPVLRKDFTVDEYMIYEAKCLGASAVLLIVSLLEEVIIKRYIRICDELGLSALVECHDDKEVDTALCAGARVIGVNNRNLKDFSVDTGLAERLRDRVPENVAFVSESGVRDPSDIEAIRRSGADAVLIGEALMRSEDKAGFLSRLRSGDF
ncbi:MAG: indole-3-glycerol phosphate synthase TrpC [Lachnospiraceae bacterium]|nr:indole-3-glycerol phosphate synthase TrpC [Lachnospiraceae bacterium]